MNLPELIIFLFVTGTTGAGIGVIVGLFTGNIAPTVKLGVQLGPIFGAVALVLWVASIRLKDRRRNMGIIAGISAFFTVLNGFTAKSYTPSPEEVANTLRRVLDGTMTWPEWDEFICVPMRHNATLERIRRRCADLEESEEFCTRTQQDEHEKWIYNQKGLHEVKLLLGELEKDIQQSASSNLTPQNTESKR